MKHLNFYLLCIGLLIGLNGFAQKTKKSTGEYQLRLKNTGLNEEEACEECIQKARINAIEKAFGSVVIQGNTTFIENVKNGKQVKTNSIFNTMAETLVIGEWLETLSEECEPEEIEGEIWFECTVKGVVRELVTPKIDFEVFAMDCDDTKCETEMFKDGEDFFMHFKSPIDGYITIYLADQEISQRILPYSNMPSGMENGVKIEADKEYILFSEEKDAFGLKRYVDEYQVYTDADIDLNRVFIIFSEEPIRKPALYDDLMSTSDSDSDRYEMPDHLPFEDFYKWMANNRKVNKTMQIENLDITIQK